MNSLFLLLGDEFRGFIKSKIMIALWVGMPVLAIILHFIQPDTEGIPMTLFTGIFIASIGGLLGAVMLSTSLVNELNANVYDLFLIRPVKRWHILFAKYVAVFLCITLASILSFAAGLVVQKPGTSVISPEELKTSFKHEISHYLKESIEVKQKVIEGS